MSINSIIHSIDLGSLGTRDAVVTFMNYPPTGITLMSVLVGRTNLIELLTDTTRYDIERACGASRGELMPLSEQSFNLWRDEAREAL